LPRLPAEQYAWTVVFGMSDIDRFAIEIKKLEMQ
jgi:hypothetical protein